MTKRLVSFFAFFLLLFVLAISEIEAIKPVPKLFETPSETYSGKCNDEACDKKCSFWEGAVHGACHLREDEFGCFCYYNSYKDNSYGSPPPPKKVGSPSPSPSPPPKSGSSSPSPSPSSAPPPKGGYSPPPPY